jgi:hypothetical protein
MSFELLPTIPVQGVPTFAAPAGALASRFDSTGTVFDRVYVSNGPFAFLSALQITDGAEHQYRFNETAGSIAVDTGYAGQNGTYYPPYTLALPGYIPGESITSTIGFLGYVEFPYSDFTHGAGGAFSIEFVCLDFPTTVPGTTACLFNTGDPRGENAGINIYAGNSVQHTGVVIGTSAGPLVADAIIQPPVPIAHIAVTYDGTNLLFYLNGAVAASGSGSGTFNPAVHNFYLGIDHIDGTGAAPNQFSCLGIYDKVLTPAQIENHYLSIINGTGVKWSDVQAFSLLNGGTFNSVVNSLNFQGGGLSLSSSNEEGTITVPGISFSGTSIDFISTGPGISGTIIGGNTLNISSPGSIPVSASIVIENNGVSLGSFGTINAVGNVTASASGGVVNISSSGTAGGGGGFVVISNTVVSGAANVEFTGLVAGYEYEIYGYNIGPSASNQLEMRYGTGSGPTWLTGSVYYWGATQLQGGFNSNANPDSKMGLSGVATNDQNLSLILRIYGDVTVPANHLYQGFYTDGLQIIGGAINTALTLTAISALEIYYPTANISGTFQLRGYVI